MSTTTSRPTLASLLPDDLTVGEPDLAGPLALFPLHARPDAREYLSFVEASAHGCTVHELEPASVNDVVVDTRSTCPCCCSRARRSRAPSKTGRWT